RSSFSNLVPQSRHLYSKIGIDVYPHMVGQAFLPVHWVLFSPPATRAQSLNTSAKPGPVPADGFPDTLSRLAAPFRDLIVHRDRPTAGTLASCPASLWKAGGPSSRSFPCPHRAPRGWSRQPRC